MQPHVAPHAATPERERLAATLAELTVRLDRMQRATKAALLGSRVRLQELGFSPARVEALLEPDPATGLRGFPGEAIRAVAERVARVRAALAKLDEQPAALVHEDRVSRQIQIFLPRKCREEPRLEAAGFVWAPIREVWQRPISHGARAAAQVITAGLF